MNGHKTIHVSHPIAVPSNSDFPIQNIPFGIFSPKFPSDSSSNLPDAGQDQRRKRACTIIGDHVVDLAVLEAADCFREVFAAANSGGAEGIFSQVSKPSPVTLSLLNFGSLFPTKRKDRDGN
jgi:hypothetical protein